MTDSELLDYVERKRWMLVPVFKGDWIVEDITKPKVDNWDSNILSHESTLRQALLVAIKDYG